VDDQELEALFDTIRSRRDQAMFRIMLRCGLRVQEIADLTTKAINLPERRIVVYGGKWRKDRIVFVSDDAYSSLNAYLKRRRPASKSRRVFLVEKGRFRGHPISVRGIQHRMQVYAKRAGLKISCHQLRHTMATQLLNADAKSVTIQELLGHNCIASTQRYCRISNPKVREDYFKAMELVLLRTLPKAT
jgi:site-specific recombinase XerD